MLVLHHFPEIESSDNHLRNTLPTQSLTASKIVVTDAGDKIEDRRNQQENGGCNQTASATNQTDPLDGAHNPVDKSTHVVRRETAHELIKLGRRRANSEEEGDFDEDEQGAGDTTSEG